MAIPTFPRIFHGFFELHIFRVDRIDAPQLGALLLYSSWSRFLTFLTKFLASTDQAVMFPEFVSAASPDHVYSSGGFSFHIVNCVNPVQSSDRLRLP